ncbi:hypothetical protein [Streptomyces cyaneofuscatus]|uniref:hypothetical protein n=1 Tax=Streptomyces cyaneofuscatus TaxID=66883 RepID=UPI003819625D
MRLSDLFRHCHGCGGGQLTWRELGVLIRQLPGDARTRLALGDRDGLWGLAEQLQAAHLDTARIANWQRANAGVPEHQQSKPPPPLERPGVKGPRRITAAELLAHRERTRRNAPRAIAA